MGEPLDDRELEAALVDVGRRLAYPRGEIWPAVRSRIAERPRRWWQLDLPAYAPAVATVAFILGLALVIAADVPAMARQILRIPGVQIVQVPKSAAPTPAASATPPTSFGTPTTLAQAHVEVGAVAPSDPLLGTPDEVYLAGASALRRAILVYRVRSGIPVSPQAGVSALVVEFRGSLDQNLVGKAAGPGTVVEQVSVGDGSGFWLSGSPHQFFYLDEHGNFVQESLRLAGNTLVWQSNGMIYRLEAEVSKDVALRIAASFR